MQGLIKLKKMKRVLIFATLLSFLFVACKPDNGVTPEEPLPEPALTLLSDTLIHFESMGGEGKILYSIENPTPDGVLEVYAPATAEWLTNLHDQVYGEISFTVTPNSKEQVRSCTIMITYEHKSQMVVVEQAAGEPGNNSDIIREATDISGYYYGTRYSNTPNYYITFSNVGYDPVTDYSLPNGWYYAVDCYNLTVPEGENIILPEGKYVIDPDNTYAPMTIAAGFTKYFETDEEGKAISVIRLAEGYMEVEGTKVILCVTDDEGVTHKVTADLEGFYLEDASVNDEPEQPDPNPTDGSSTLTEDYTVDTTDWEVNAYYQGNYYGNGNANWILNLRSPQRHGDAVNLDIVAGGLGIENGIAGTYTCGTSFSQFSFYPGTFYNPYYTGCWYLQLYQGQILGDQAPFVGGTIEIIKNSDGTHTFNIECTDNAATPNTVFVNWTGVVNIYDYQ